MRAEVFRHLKEQQYDDIVLQEAHDYELTGKLRDFLISFAAHLKSLQKKAVKDDSPLFGRSMSGISDRALACKGLTNMPVDIDHSIVSMEDRGKDFAQRVANQWGFPVADYALAEGIGIVLRDTHFFTYLSYRASIEADTSGMHSVGASESEGGSDQTSRDPGESLMSMNCVMILQTLIFCLEYRECRSRRSTDRSNER